MFISSAFYCSCRSINNSSAPVLIVALVELIAEASELTVWFVLLKICSYLFSQRWNTLIKTEILLNCFYAAIATFELLSWIPLHIESTIEANFVDFEILPLLFSVNSLSFSKPSLLLLQSNIQRILITSWLEFSKDWLIFFKQIGLNVNSWACCVSFVFEYLQIWIIETLSSLSKLVWPHGKGATRCGSWYICSWHTGHCRSAYNGKSSLGNRVMTLRAFWSNWVLTWLLHRVEATWNNRRVRICDSKWIIDDIASFFF